MTSPKRRRLARSPARWASVEDVAAKAREWTPEQLVCRGEKHDFTVPLTASINPAYHGGYIATTKGCSHGCGCVRVRDETLRGRILNSYIIYSPGYLSDTGRIAGDANDEVRRLLTRQQFGRISQNSKMEPTRKWKED